MTGLGRVPRATPGLYAVSLVGGLVSSGRLGGVAGRPGDAVSADVAGTGAVITALASAAVSLPLVARLAGDAALVRRLGAAFLVVIAATACGVAAQVGMSRLG